MTRRDLREVHRRIADEAARQCAEYRELVLRYPDLVARLALPPIGKADPATWTGYIPPYAVPAGDRHTPNGSPVRAQLVDIVRAAVARTHGEPMARDWVSMVNTDHWKTRQTWTPPAVADKRARRQAH